MSEGRELLRSRMEQLADGSPRDLLRFETEPVEEVVRSESGRTYRVTVSAYDDREDGPVATVSVHGTGPRRFWRWRATVSGDYLYPEDGPPTLSDELTPSDVNTRTQDYLVGGCAITVILLLVAPWFIGVGFLISLLF